MSESVRILVCVCVCVCDMHAGSFTVSVFHVRPLVSDTRSRLDCAKRWSEEWEKNVPVQLVGEITHTHTSTHIHTHEHMPDVLTRMLTTPVLLSPGGS